MGVPCIARLCINWWVRYNIIKRIAKIRPSLGSSLLQEASVNPMSGGSYYTKLESFPNTKAIDAALVTSSSHRTTHSALRLNQSISKGAAASHPSRQLRGHEVLATLLSYFENRFVLKLEPDYSSVVGQLHISPRSQDGVNLEYHQVIEQLARIFNPEPVYLQAQILRIKPVD